MMDTAEQRLQALGITLPAAPAPVAVYRPWVIAGDLLFVSGQLPIADGSLRFTGKVGRDMDADQGREAARVAAINGLAQVRAALGSLDGIIQCVKLTGFVNSAAGFTAQPAVLNGASELLAEVFGDAGLHARAAVGVSELPLDAAVEIEFIFQISV
jgi:enamine deaminase RidA (YjgF/YER057c/UK114 family)